MVKKDLQYWSQESICYETAVSDTREESCICGKEKLKYLFFIHNKNIQDDLDRTCSKIIVGELINF